jgi:hypothetical protein
MWCGFGETALSDRLVIAAGDTKKSVVESTTPEDCEESLDVTRE